MVLLAPAYQHDIAIQCLWNNITQELATSKFWCKKYIKLAKHSIPSNHTLIQLFSVKITTLNSHRVSMAGNTSLLHHCLCAGTLQVGQASNLNTDHIYSTYACLGAQASNSNTDHIYST